MICFSIQTLPEIVLLGHSICQKGWGLPLRSEHEYELVFPYQGEFLYRREETEQVVAIGDCLLIPRNTYHRVYTENQSRCRFFYVHFLPGTSVREITEDLSEETIREWVLQQTDELSTELQAPFYRLSRPGLQEICLPEKLHLREQERDEIFSLFDRAMILRNKPSPFSRTEITLLMCQVMINVSCSLLHRAPRPDGTAADGAMPRLLQEVLFYMQENYTADLSVKSVSDRFHVSQQYLIRLFRRHLAVSPGKYTGRLRMSMAKSMMRYSDMNLKEICYAVGMENPHYFSRLFKKLEGVSPSEYKAGLDSRSNE